MLAISLKENVRRVGNLHSPLSLPLTYFPGGGGGVELVLELDKRCSTVLPKIVGIMTQMMCESQIEQQQQQQQQLYSVQFSSVYCFAISCTKARKKLTI